MQAEPSIVITPRPKPAAAAEATRLLAALHEACADGARGRGLAPGLLLLPLVVVGGGGWWWSSGG